ncbi:MAG: Fe-S-containing protein [ANME-2 cluster archaeon]|nr:Fe-S-containing protein [ANME-2 cluster archaeon]
MKPKHIMITVLLAGLVLVTAGCTGGSNSQSGPVKAKWITVTVSGDQVSIPQSDVDKYTNVHFNVPTSNYGPLAFMAYNLDGKTYVRANVCPPCNSIGFSLDNGVLVCDSCGTLFEADTGNGISGGCVAYPKEEVAYTVQNGQIVMNINDAITAYGATVQVG